METICLTNSHLINELKGLDREFRDSHLKHNSLIWGLTLKGL